MAGTLTATWRLHDRYTLAQEAEFNPTTSTLPLPSRRPPIHPYTPSHSFTSHPSNNSQEIFLNFIALTFIVNLDDMIMQCPLFRPYRQHLLARKMVDSSGTHEVKPSRVLLQLDGDLTIRLTWSGPTFVPEQAPHTYRYIPLHTKCCIPLPTITYRYLPSLVPKQAPCTPLHVVAHHCTPLRNVTKTSHAFLPEQAPRYLKWLLGERAYRLLGYGMRGKANRPVGGGGDVDLSTFNPHMQLPITADFRGQRLMMLAVLSLVHQTLLLTFSNFGRIEKVIETGRKEWGPHDMLRLFRLLAHSFLGFSMATMYVEHIAIASGVGWLVTQLVLLAISEQCVVWGLTMAEMLLPAGERCMGYVLTYGTVLPQSAFLLISLTDHMTRHTSQRSRGWRLLDSSPCCGASRPTPCTPSSSPA